MTRTSTFIVTDLCCATEENSIRTKLTALRGIEELRFNIVSKKLTVRHSCPTGEILESLKSVGLPGTLVSRDQRPDGSAGLRNLKITTGLGGGLFLSGLVASWLNAPPAVSIPLYLSAIALSGWRPALRALSSLRSHALDMNLLMTVAVIGALILGEYAEGAAVIVLFAVSLLLEALSTERSRRAIESLMDLSPPTARIRLSDREATFPVGEVPVDAVMVIRPGERIPLDGEVTSGTSTVDESALTGESVPIWKHAGSPVYAGSYNQRGSLDVRVTKRIQDSTLSRIIKLVEEAQSHKAPAQTFVERFATVYTPAVFILALGIAVLPPLLFGGQFADWSYRALVLLVIACPCALVISTPVSVINAITSAARQGILVKGGRPLEQLAGARAIALDKTGTVTYGSAVVTDVIRLNSLPETEILRIASAIETRSEHHLAQAILEKAGVEGIDVNSADVRDFESIPGKGIRATVDGRKYSLGNHPFVEELGLCSSKLESILQSLEDKGRTVVVLSEDTGPVGVFGIADEIRQESRQAVSELRNLGIRHLTLLTGDNRGTAERTGAELGVDEVRFELLPETKLEAIRSLREKHGCTVMVGDGVNDAPALAAADVGIAMGGVGSDSALETADVVLMSDNLDHIAQAIRLGRKTLAIIRQNIGIALATKAVFLGLGVMGMSSLWLAILADDGATLVVILNSLRLLKK